MRRSMLPLLLAIAAGAAAPGHAAARDFPAVGFDRIDLSGTAELAVHTGAGFSVHAEGDPDAVEALTVEARGGTLRIGFRPGTRMLRGRVRVAVALPRLAAIAGSGTGSIAVDRVSGPAFEASLSGTGSLHLPEVAVERFSLNGSGTSRAIVAGRAGRIDLDLSGTGGIDASRLAARGGRIELSGVGSVHALVDGPVEVTNSGIGSVVVAGHPACTIHRDGLGSVRCG